MAADTGRFLCLLSVLVPLFGTRAADTSLETVLARMDSAAPKFRGLRADVRRVTHTEIVQSDEIETGKIAVRRPSPKDLRMRVDVAQHSGEVGDQRVRDFSRFSHALRQVLVPPLHHQRMGGRPQALERRRARRQNVSP